jgi:NAD(P)-dependent dehydrogenase (short-subunit alcohol dehydrogenase family)
MGLLDGKIAVVTGASTGIGRATACVLAREGARVVVAARNEDKLESLCDKIQADGGVAVAVPTDITDASAVSRLADRTRAEFGGADVLVNSAGIADWSNIAILGSDLEQWEREVQTNLLALMSLTHHVAEIMRDGGGDIVNISSGADRGFAAAYPAYVASKWGVSGFTGSAALALREAGIRVTLLSPGEVATPMQPEEDVRSMRMLDPDDVAETVLFAVSRPRHVAISEIRINPSHLD